jgi:hypothetical protein
VPGLAKWERINSIEPSWFDAATAYMAVDEHKLGDRRPMVYVTHDNGAHWASIASNLPVDSYARIVREDPVRRNMLYLGTESGLWYSFDGGASWQRMNGIPQVPVYDVKVQRRFNDLVVGTHGRSIWILDDLSPYQQFTSSVGSSAMHLFTVRSAYRWSGSVGTWATYGSVEGAGDNPVFGADIDFYLKAAPKKGESVRLQISDATGVVNTITPDHLQAGINRVYWDLTVHPWTPPAMLKPDTDGGFSAPLGSPGTYTVRLTYDGKTQEQPIQVLADPRSHYSATDIAAQNAFLMRLRGDVVKVADTIVTLSATQKQHPSPKLQAALETLYQPKLRHWRDDLRYPPGLYEEFSTLTGLVQGSDARPPQSFLDAASCLEQRLNQVLNTVNAAPPR